MAFQKLNYIDEVTVIPAENLNAIQDELIRLISALDGGSLKGDTGVGIASIRQTTTSNTDGGNNVFTVTLTDGTSATFTVKNGSKGSTGSTPVFQIGTVTTLNAGSNATASITGTATNPVLNLGIPKGRDGTSGSGGGGTGADGEDGGYYIPSVNSSSVLSWTPSKSGMPSVQSSNIKGQDGKTPVRGTDYWTSSDIAEIKSYVDEAILGGAW